MGVILILILASLGVALLFLGGFIWAVRSGQFEDTFTPAMRILTDEVAPGARFTETASASTTDNFSQAGERPAGESRTIDVRER
jgi:cbb3-type cytochrome oxidase maturation protein